MIESGKGIEYILCLYCATLKPIRHLLQHSYIGHDQRSQYLVAPTIAQFEIKISLKKKETKTKTNYTKQKAKKKKDRV